MRLSPPVPPPVSSLLAALLVLTAACATAGPNEEPEPEPRLQSATQVITQDEILATDASNAWEALRATVRFVVWRETVAGSPQMANRRGTSSMLGPEDVRIMIDGADVLDLRDLRLISARDIEEIRVLSPLEATTWFGTNSGAGAILIITH